MKNKKLHPNHILREDILRTIPARCTSDLTWHSPRRKQRLNDWPGRRRRLARQGGVVVAEDGAGKGAAKRNHQGPSPPHGQDASRAAKVYFSFSGCAC